MSKTISADTKTVRAFFDANPTLVPEGDKTVGAASSRRGRVSADAKRIFAEQNPGTKFVEGTKAKATVALTYKHEQPSGRKVSKTVNLLPAEVRALVPEAPDRGKMSAANLTLAAERYAAQVKAAREAETTESE